MSFHTQNKNLPLQTHLFMDDRTWQALFLVRTAGKLDGTWRVLFLARTAGKLV